MQRNKFPIKYKTLCCDDTLTFTYDGQMIYCKCWNSKPGEDNPGIALDIGDGYYMRVLGSKPTNLYRIEDE